MPSCTVPTFSKIEVMTHIIQPAMLLMRIASPVVTAMAPSEIAPWLHSQSASPVVPVMSMPVKIHCVISNRGDDPELRPVLEEVIGDRLLGVSVLAFRVGEQLHGQDVGVAIHDPPDQQRTRLRDNRGPLDQLRHEKPDHGEKPASQPNSGTSRRASSWKKITAALVQ